MPNPDLGSVTPQFPLNTGGPLGPNGIAIAAHFYVASGGMVQIGRIQPSGALPATGIQNVTPQGFPGFSATLVGTGLYDIRHPPANILKCWPEAVLPSGGAPLVPKMERQIGNSASGVMRFSMNQPQFQAPSGSPASGFTPANPPTGTRMDLLFYVQPTQNPAGVTQF
jgi:hypothetical protein